MPAGRKTPSEKLEALQQSLPRMSSIQLLDLLASQLINLETSFGGRNGGRTRDFVLRYCQVITSELRRREQQTSLF